MSLNDVVSISTRHEPLPWRKEGFNPSVGGAFKCGWPSEHFSVDSPPRINTEEETENKMAVAFKPFKEYMKCLASGKLDGYLDSTRREDKLTVSGVLLPNDPNLLLHNLGMGVDMERIKNLFINDTVFVAPSQL